MKESGAERTQISGSKTMTKYINTKILFFVITYRLPVNPLIATLKPQSNGPS